MLTPTFIWHSDSDQLSALKQGIKLAQDANSASVLILACCQNDYPNWAIDPFLRTIEIPIFGGAYPQLIFGESSMSQGVIIVGFSHTLSVSNICQLDQKTTYIEGLELILENDCNLQSHQNFLMFYDGLSLNSEDFIDSFYDCAGCDVNVIGGGAGSLDFVQRPCVFSNKGMLVDAMQFVGLPGPLDVGVAHGWEILDGPYLVTEARGSLIVSINYQPAKDFYQQRVEEISYSKFFQKDFYDVAKLFPLGIEGANGEILVRDPIKTVGSGLQCVGNVPVNSMIYILKSDTESLVAAASIAANCLGSVRPSVLVFDCISRFLYMDQGFKQELAAINAAAENSSFVVGALSLGEVANAGSGAISLLNKSTAIGRF